jgi:protein TonB
VRRSDPIELAFHGVAAGVVLLGAAIALTRPPQVPAAPPPKPEEPFVVALQAPPPEPPPEPKAPPPEPKAPPPKAPPPVTLPTPAPPPPLPTPPLPAILPTPPQPTPPPAPPAPAPVPPPVTPAPAAPSSANAENSYIGKLRAYIRSITEYPTSGDARRTRPEGAVLVRFTLTRNGQLRDASVEKPSGSTILDKKALAIVRAGSYPAMPREVWANDSEHVFTVTVEFVAP